MNSHPTPMPENPLEGVASSLPIRTPCRKTQWRELHHHFPSEPHAGKRSGGELRYQFPSEPHARKGSGENCIINSHPSPMPENAVEESCIFTGYGVSAWPNKHSRPPSPQTPPPSFPSRGEGAAGSPIEGLGRRSPEEALTHRKPAARRTRCLRDEPFPSQDPLKRHPNPTCLSPMTLRKRHPNPTCLFAYDPAEKTSTPYLLIAYDPEEPPAGLLHLILPLGPAQDLQLETIVQTGALETISNAASLEHTGELVTVQFYADSPQIGEPVPLYSDSSTKYQFQELENW
jgi:hypothetical protein